MARINQNDVDAVQKKLQAFSKDLPEQEQNVLAWILTRSNEAELTDAELEDVAGGDEVTVSWKKTLNDM
ncbi:MAG TPA: hypothetical protein VF615_10960 [Longimicrobiaceae bacterium]|jgi:hypothetical protein